MELLTPKIIHPLPPLHTTKAIPAGEKNKQIVVCHFFMPDFNWNWFVLAGEAVNEPVCYTKTVYRFFGIVQHGVEKELGCFFLDELKKIRGPLGLPIQRNLFLFKKSYGDLIKRSK